MKNLTEKLLSNLRRGALRASLRDGRVVFSGGSQGEHSISLDVSSRARILAHWEGYCEANGLTAKPKPGAAVMFQRGMFGAWPGTVVSACPTSAVIRYKRRNGYVATTRVELPAVSWG